LTACAGARPPRGAEFHESYSRAAHAPSRRMARQMISLAMRPDAAAL